MFGQRNPKKFLLYMSCAYIRFGLIQQSPHVLLMCDIGFLRVIMMSFLSDLLSLLVMMTFMGKSIANMTLVRQVSKPFYIFSIKSQLSLFLHSLFSIIFPISLRLLSRFLRFLLVACTHKSQVLLISLLIST